MEGVMVEEEEEVMVEEEEEVMVVELIVEGEEEVMVEEEEEVMVEWEEGEKVLCLILFRVDAGFQQRFKQYLDGDVVVDIQSMVTHKPQLTYLKQLVLPDVKIVHR